MLDSFNNCNSNSGIYGYDYTVPKESIAEYTREEITKPDTHSLMNHVWVIAGTMIGLSLGGASNYIQKNSLFTKNLYICKEKPFESSAYLAEVNHFREYQLILSRGRMLSGDTPSLISPYCPLIYLMPLVICTLWNLETSKKTFKQILAHGWKHLAQNAIFPSLHATSMTYGSFMMRKLYFSHLNKYMKLDISGHVLYQIAQNLFAIRSLKALEETFTPLQRKTFIIMNIAVAITDGIWMYNTAANCHSVAEVVGGIACSSITFLLIEASIMAVSQLYSLGNLDNEQSMLAIPQENTLDEETEVFIPI